MIALIYVFSLLIVLLTIAGITISNEGNYSGTDKHRSLVIAFLILCPVINSIMACAIIVAAIWLLFFRHE